MIGHKLRILAANGHEVGLVVDSLANDAQTESKVTALLPHASLNIHRFAMSRLLGTGDLVTPLAVRKLARSLEIDVLHGHGAKGGFYARMAKLGGIKTAALYPPMAACCTLPSRPCLGACFMRSNGD